MASFGRAEKSDSIVSRTIRFCAHLVHGVAEADEEALQIVLARLLDLAPLHVHVVDVEEAPGAEIAEVEAERRDVLAQLLAALLERDEDAVLAVLRRPADEELHAEEGLAAAGGPADQGRPASGAALRSVISSNPRIPVRAFSIPCGTLPPFLIRPTSAMRASPRCQCSLPAARVVTAGQSRVAAS